MGGIKIEDAYTQNGPAVWNYFKDPNAPQCPRGKKVQLLTIGFVQVSGEYTDGGHYIAWSGCIQRDKVKERELGII